MSGVTIHSELPWKEAKKIELKYEGALDTVKTREEAALKLLDKQKIRI